MDSNVYTTQKEYSDIIRELRFCGDINSAILKCIEATEKFPENNFFYKILGDLYLQIGNYENASKAYLEHLKCLYTRPERFSSFAQFYRRLENKVSNDFLNAYRLTITGAIKNGSICPNIAEQLFIFFGEPFAMESDIWDFLQSTESDRNLKQVKTLIEEKISTNDINVIRVAIDYRIAALNRNKSRQTDGYFIALAERLEMYAKALALVEKKQGFLDNPIGIRTILRICRKLNDYSYAEKKLKFDEKFIDKSDFNILYELVYYFEINMNDDLLIRTLLTMRNMAENSVPIARTLYNFYLRLNKFSEAKEISEHIKNLEISKKHRARDKSKINSRIEAQADIEQELLNKLEESFFEKEHTRQMIAIRDLLKGFSHELGQPITNIRYSVQLCKMKIENNTVTIGDMTELFNLILSQTERIGKMLTRFSPIVTKKSVDDWFNVFEKISDVFADLNARLNENGIKYLIKGNKFVKLYGDAVQFEQIFYNLTLNSMQAMSSCENSGNIDVFITKESDDKIKISYTDNGPGISEGISKKIFEPFFSTKDPSSGDGGEGLGLYIVWNILKMFDGRIHLNKEYKSGAKFDMIIPLKGGNLNE